MPKKRKKSKKRKSKKRKLKKKNIRKIKISKKKINSHSNDELIYKTKKEWTRQSLVNKKEYEKKYNQSIKDNDGFWRKEGKRINWIKPYTKIKDVKYSKEDVSIKYYGWLRQRFSTRRCNKKALRNNQVVLQESFDSIGACKDKARHQTCLLILFRRFLLR